MPALIDAFQRLRKLQLSRRFGVRQHSEHRVQQAFQILGADDERRHQIDDVAERPHPNAVPHESCSQHGGGFMSIFGNFFKGLVR